SLTMSWLLHAGLSNAALAAILVVPAWVVSRNFRRPALAHALWLLVLLKLVTPPLIPVRFLPALPEPARPPVQVAVAEPVADAPKSPTQRTRSKPVPPAKTQEQKRLAKDMAVLDKLIPPELRTIMPPAVPSEPLGQTASVVEDAPEEPELIDAP